MAQAEHEAALAEAASTSDASAAKLKSDLDNLAVTTSKAVAEAADLRKELSTVMAARDAAEAAAKEARAELQSSLDKAKAEKEVASKVMEDAGYREGEQVGGETAPAPVAVALVAAAPEGVGNQGDGSRREERLTADLAASRERSRELEGKVAALKVALDSATVFFQEGGKVKEKEKEKSAEGIKEVGTSLSQRIPQLSSVILL